MRPKSSCVMATLGLLLPGAACSTGTPLPCGPGNAATTTADWVYATNTEAGLYFAAVDPIPLSLYTFSAPPTAAATSILATNAVVAAAGNNFPNHCASASANQNVVTFDLANCSGPLGITSLSGVVVETLTVTGNGQIQAQLTGNNLAAKGATFDLNTSGSVTVAGNGQKTLTATSMSTGTGPGGNSIARSGTYTVLWPTGTGCATINAGFSGSSSLDAGSMSTTISNYVACTGECAQSGTSATTASGQSVTLTLTYNGSTSALCNASNGQIASVALTCP
jgi:hypothetical protein